MIAVDWRLTLSTRYAQVGRPVDWRHGWVGVGRVTRADAAELTKELGDECVDCVLLHPSSDVGVTLPDEHWKQTRADDQMAAFDDLAAECARVLKPGGIVISIGDARALASWYIAASWAELLYVGDLAVVWSELPRKGPYKLDVPPSSVLWMHRFVKRGGRERTDENKVRLLRSNVLVCEPVPDQHRLTFEQLPVEVYEELLNVFTYDDALVLDPMCGTGSSIVACERQGRRWIAGDRDRWCVEVARERVAHADVEDVGQLAYWNE